MVVRIHLLELNAYCTSGQLLLQAQQLAALKKPAAHDLSSVWNWLTTESSSGEGLPLVEMETAFVLKDDLVTLSPGRESARLNAFIENIRFRPMEVC